METLGVVRRSSQLWSRILCAASGSARRNGALAKRGLQSTETLIRGTSSNFLPLASSDGISCAKTDHLLEILNCTGCPYLKKVVIPLTASCFHLAKLNLNLSANLKEDSSVGRMWRLEAGDQRSEDAGGSEAFA
ncbi:hypothetical protein KSP40_PGU020134 [Platanthera guangdongensis]|uniref:Uncharacterized protein n=1 Tax=Platanthera guangdongensis TaxID=2320717 RepID=A0ABR2LCR7_9ASPA